jgi:hypothetical protein
MRWLLPWRTLEIETRLSPEEIVDALSPHLDPREPRLFGPRIDAAWIGRVNRKRLAMRRRISHNNGCLPRIEATIEPRGEGARVLVRMRMDVAPQIVIGVWMASASLSAVICVISSVLERKPSGLVALILPICNLLMTAVSFAPEAGVAEAFLRERLPPPLHLKGSPFRRHP